MKKERLQQSAEMQKIIRDYYEQLYGNKMLSTSIPGRNGQILRKVQSSKNEQGRNRKNE